MHTHDKDGEPTYLGPEERCPYCEPEPMVNLFLADAVKQEWECFFDSHPNMESFALQMGKYATIIIKMESGEMPAYSKEPTGPSKEPV